jgi:hypothetical protein
MVGCGVRYPNPKIKVVTMARLIYSKLGAYLVLIKYTYQEIIRRVRKISKSDCYLRRDSPSVRPYGTTWLPLERFSWNFISKWFFGKLSRKFYIWAFFGELLRKIFIWVFFGKLSRKVKSWFLSSSLYILTKRSSVYFRNVGINLPKTQKWNTEE